MGFFKRDPAPKPTAVDLRERGPKLDFGFPTPCPECGENGYLDSIDLIDQRMYQHCPSCDAKWTTSEQELSST